MPTRPISFLSDYGVVDEFVGVVHGVIGRISPDVRVIDIGHGSRRGDVRAGALALLRAIQYLPKGVVLAVVDPGVGTGRRAIAAETEWGFFVGPDNGLLAPAVAMVGGVQGAASLEDPRFRLPGHGATFDGRDVFAPAAAVLATGEAGLGDLGPAVEPSSLTPLLLPLVEVGDGVADGEVWWVDSYGNAQTNVSPDDLAAIGLRMGDPMSVRIGGLSHDVVWSDSYGVDSQVIAHVDSHGLMALAVAGGRADERLALSEGISIGFRKPTPTG